jgi:hypothetical protein
VRLAEVTYNGSGTAPASGTAPGSGLAETSEGIALADSVVLVEVGRIVSAEDAEDMAESTGSFRLAVAQRPRREGSSASSFIRNIRV